MRVMENEYEMCLLYSWNEPHCHRLLPKKIYKMVTTLIFQ